MTRRSGGVTSAVCGLFIVLASGCGGDKQESAARPDSVAPAASAPRAPFTEPEAAQILRAIDQARAAGAQAVRARSQNESVLEYARVVTADHGVMTMVLDSLLRATGQHVVDHALGHEFLNEAQSFAAELAVRDTGINNSYLAREVRDHERALQLLEGAFIPAAQTPALRTALQQLVPAYHAHLQRAREILAQRTGGASRPSAATGRAAAPAGSPTPQLRGTPVSPAPRPAQPAQPRPDTALRLLGRPLTSTTNM